MARLNFVSWEEMKRRARELRRKKLTSEEARAKTGRLPAQRNPGGKKRTKWGKWKHPYSKRTLRSAGLKSFRYRSAVNPGGGFMKRVVEAAKEFKRKHGGQAYGWAADQASMAPRGEKQRFWAEVTALLRREVYATNPKRYSRQVRKKVKHRGEQRRAMGKLARASKRWRHHVKRRLSSKGSKHLRRANKWDTSLQYWGDKASDWYARRNNPKRYSRQKRAKKARGLERGQAERIRKKLVRANRAVNRHAYQTPRRSRAARKWLRAQRKLQDKRWRNPRGTEMGYCSICSRALPDGSTTEHVALGERPSKRFCFRKEFGHDTNCDRIAKGLRANPKRDGTPTRGEKRKDKYKDHLRALRERGAKAADELNKLLGRGAHRPHSEPVLKAPTTQTQLEHPGHYAAEESSDQKFAKEQLSQVESLMSDVRSQMKDLDDADEALADELSDQLIKLGSQRKALQERAKGAVMTNPRRRNPRYTSPARYRRMSSAQRAKYRHALRALRSTIHSL